MPLVVTSELHLSMAAPLVAMVAPAVAPLGRTGPSKKLILLLALRREVSISVLGAFAVP